MMDIYGPYIDKLTGMETRLKDRVPKCWPCRIWSASSFQKDPPGSTPYQVKIREHVPEERKSSHPRLSAAYRLNQHRNSTTIFTPAP